MTLKHQQKMPVIQEKSRELIDEKNIL